jgi:hypothetical protein
MKLRELAVPYVVQEVDYAALQQYIEEVFTEQYGPATVHDVRVAHFNPDVIDATVFVETRKPEMDATVIQLSEAFRREGLRVGIRVAQSPQKIR